MDIFTKGSLQTVATPFSPDEPATAQDFVIAEEEGKAAIGRHFEAGGENPPQAIRSPCLGSSAVLSPM
jgi:hypothetical protein